MTTGHILYGLKNCDTCRKASAWLNARNLPHRFHDLRADGLDRRLLEEWESSLGWENLLNRKSTTWRQLDESGKAPLDRELAMNLMLAHPSLVKRPILAIGDRLVHGFTPGKYESET